MNFRHHEKQRSRSTQLSHSERISENRLKSKGDSDIEALSKKSVRLRRLKGEEHEKNGKATGERDISLWNDYLLLPSSIEHDNDQVYFEDPH